MRKLLFFCCCPFILIAQSALQLPLSVVVPDDFSNESPSSAKYLKSKLQQYVSEDGGVGELAEDYSFIVYPQINILDETVTASMPQVHVVKMDLVCFVVNAKPDNMMGVKSILFNSQSFSLRGVGQSREKALTNALNRIGTTEVKTDLKVFFEKSREKIKAYFNDNCDAMINEAELLAKEANLSVNNIDPTDPRGQSVSYKASLAEAKFASGINLLKTLRIANTSCYDDKTDKIDHILSLYDDFACNYYFSLAKNHWALRQQAETIAYLDKIPPSKKCKEEVASLLADMEKYVDDPEKNLQYKIDMWNKAGGREKAQLEIEAYKELQLSTKQFRRMDAERTNNRDFMILRR